MSSGSGCGTFGYTGKVSGICEHSIDRKLRPLSGFGDMSPDPRTMLGRIADMAMYCQRFMAALPSTQTWGR